MPQVSFYVTKVNRFLEPFEIVSFDDATSVTYASIRSSLELKGKPIGPDDLIIASTVLSNQGVLVTNDQKEFKRVKRLRAVNWTG